MREIKFRAWDERAKDMAYFGLGEDYLTTFDKENSDVYTLELSSKPPIMQFTGLKDKNGREIYEGDIVQYWFKYTSPKKLISQVEFFNYAWRLNRLWLFSEIHEIEVIGNIYENPNLLEK